MLLGKLNCSPKILLLENLCDSSSGVFSCRPTPQGKVLEYGRVFPSKTLRNVPAFARAFAQAYARANARAKAKGGGVIPESGCEVGVAWVWPLWQLTGQNENGLLSWMGFCPGTWMGFCPGTWMAGTWISNGALPGHMDGVLPGHMDGVLPGHMDGAHRWGFAWAHGWGFAWAHGWGT